jgi:hypothetical protein
MAALKPKHQQGIIGCEIVQDLRFLDSREIDYIQVLCPEGSWFLEEE